MPRRRPILLTLAILLMIAGFQTIPRNGQVTIPFANGDKYFGEFRNDNYHGQGTHTSSDGRVKESIWENESFKFAQKVIPKVSAVIAPTTSADTRKPRSPKDS